MRAFDIRDARVSDVPQIARIHVDSWRETYQGLVPQAMLDRLRYEQREEIWSNALHRQNGMEFVLVAEWIDGVYGFASGGRERSGYRGYQGELYAIYVLLAAQKRGAGRALFESLMSRLADRGYDSMLLWVLDGNPACGFYEAMGGQRVGHKDERFDDAVLREVAYGWPLDRR